MSTSGGSSGGGGSGTVTSVAAADTSVVIGGTPTVTPTVATGTLDVIATQHPPVANWSNNSRKITSLLNGSGAQDAAAFGQVPVVDTVAADIQPAGTAAAGSNGKWADSGHVHPNTAPGATLAQLNYTMANNSSYTTTSTTLVAIDTTNLALTFTAPPSGNVWVETEGVYSSAAGTGGYVGVLSAGSPVGPAGNVLQTSQSIRTPYSFLVTGLTPGTSYTFQMAFFTQTAADALTLRYGETSVGPSGGIKMKIVAA